MQFSSLAVLAVSAVSVFAQSSAQAISQIGDGQIQASTATEEATSTAQVISQISDGQIQASTATEAPAATSSAAVISQISDGQIQATASTASVEVQSGNGAAQLQGAGIAAVAAGALFLI